jgi:hypothetical protein
MPTLRYLNRPLRPANMTFCVGWALVAHHLGAQTKTDKNQILVGMNADPTIPQPPPAACKYDVLRRVGTCCPPSWSTNQNGRNQIPVGMNAHPTIIYIVRWLLVRA